MPNFLIRCATPDDLPEMKKLYVDTITAVCVGEYTTEQLTVWASSVEKTERWLDLVNMQVVFAATKDNVLVGFSSLENGCYIDFMYVHKDFQRQGIADALLNAVEAEAKKQGTSTLTSDISKTARPFFEKRGYKVLAEQVNMRKGIELINYKMSKDL
jgi:putative acetyltransferase